jgi:hypothetical protein
MAGDIDNPRIWSGADVYVAPVGTTAPTNLSSSLNAAYKALGLLGEDGATENRDQDVTDHYAWGGILVRTTRSKHKRTITVIALEDNLTVLGLVEPNSVTTDNGTIATTIVSVPSNPDPRSFVLQLSDGTVDKRRHIARGEVTEVAEITLADSEMTAYELTISIYPVDEVLYTDITDDPQRLSA